MAFLCRSFVLLMSGLCLVCVGGEVLSGSEKIVFLAAHNGFRRSTSPPAADMIKLQWSDDVAGIADAWVLKCDDGNDRFLNNGRPAKTKLGQNNWYGNAEEYATTPSIVVNEWMKHKDNYMFKKRRCSGSVSAKECADFTQVVMATSKYIGCAMNTCEDGAKVLVTCLYELGGTVFFKPPYKAGVSCSQCPGGYACDDKLCVPAKVGERELIERLLEML